MATLSELAQMDIDDVVANVQLRSSAIRAIISESPKAIGYSETPRTLVQFWDCRDVPNDVRECLDSWRPLDSIGFKRRMFDQVSALSYIAENFNENHTRAFKRCSHPAMQADYFRLCFIYQSGGVYIDADDAYIGGDIEACLSGGTLKFDPLCYRTSTDTMEDPFTRTSDNGDLIFYVNNNPLAAPAGHPLVGLALNQATSRLLAIGRSRDIQKLTGPGNLTETLVRHALELTRTRRSLDFKILRNWNSIAISKWPLDYRQTDRNWRHWTREGDRA